MRDIHEERKLLNTKQTYRRLHTFIFPKQLFTIGSPQLTINTNYMWIDNKNEMINLSETSKGSVWKGVRGK